MNSKRLIFVLIVFQCFHLFCQSWSINHYTKSNILPSNFVNDLVQDHKGGLILATDIGLYRFNGASVNLIKSSTFYKKVVTSDNRLFALTKNNGIHVFENFTFSKEIQLSQDQDLIDLAFLENKIYALSTENLFVQSLNSTKVSSYEVQKASCFLKHDSTIRVIAENKIRSFQSGLFKNVLEVDEKIVSADIQNDLLIVSLENKVLTYSLEVSGYSLVRKKEYKKVKKTNFLNDGRVLILQEDLVQLEFKGRVDVLTNPMFFNSNFHVVFTDQEGGVWLSEKGAGLYHIPNPEILRYGSDGVIKSVVNWLGKTTFSSNAGLILRDDKGVYTVEFTHLDITDCKPFKSQLILASQKGVYVVDSNFVINKIVDEVVNRIEVDTFNNLLYGTKENRGLAVISLETKAVKYLEIKNGLSHNIISDIESANRDTLLLCTPAGGIEVIVNGRLVDNHRFRFKQRVILNSLFYNRSRNDLYCATPNNGLFVIKNNNELKRIPFPHSVYSIFEMDESIWVTHDGGINILKDEKNIQIFEPNNPNNFFPFAHGIFKTNHELFLGIHQGFLKIIPRSNYFQKENTYSIHKIIVDDNEIEIDSTVNLPYGNYRFKFLIDYINLSAREKASLEWRMKGYNEDWNTVKENSIEFPKLNYGKYYLEIRNTDGKILPELGVTIFIDEPFWLKRWFWISALIFVAVIVYLLSYYKTKSLIKEKNRLEDLVKQRTKAIQQKNEELKQFAYVVSHDFKNPVVNISQLADIALNKSLSESKQKEVVAHIKTSSDALQKQLLGMIELLKVDSDQLPIIEVDVPLMVKRILKSLDSFVAEANACVVFNRQDFKVNTNEQYLYSILYNILSNALKYKSPKRDLIINIDLWWKSGYAHLSIRDNGLGFNMDSHKNSLFQPFRRIHTNGEGTGLGLALTKRMMHALNGTILVESIEDKGSTFELIL